MSDSKNPRRGRPRVTLTQALRRWVGDDKRHVERHIPRLLDALYREMIEFEPAGLVTQVHVGRFLRRYYVEIRCLFANPFNGVTTPEQIAAQRKEVREYVEMLLKVGAIPRREDDPAGYEISLLRALDVRMAEMAYQQAHTHVWRLRGGTGTPPEQPASDRNLMSQAEREDMDKLASLYNARAARYREAEAQAAQAAGAPAAPPAAPPEAEKAPEERTMLQAVEYGSPEDVPLPDADRIEWPGKQHNESPRDMMRPYLERIGRLDLLEGYSDEIVQYGERVEYEIDGKWR